MQTQEEEEERSPWQGWQEGRASGMAASTPGPPAAGFGDLGSSLQFLRLILQPVLCTSGTAPKTPAALQEGTGEGEEEGASAGRRSLTLPGRAGKLFPHSPNQTRSHSYDAEGQENMALLITTWYLSQKYSTSSLRVSTRAAQLY